MEVTVEIRVEVRVEVEVRKENMTGWFWACWLWATGSG